MLDKRRAAIFVLTSACVVCLGGAVRAQEVRSVIGMDSFVSSTKNLMSAAVADIAISGVVDAKSADQRVSLQADFVDRESMIGSPARRELHTLFVSWRLSGQPGLVPSDAALPAAVTLGRFRVPGGFWLIADGAMLEIGRVDQQSLAVTVGTRAFSNARSELHLRRHPVFVPLLAGSAQLRRQRFGAILSYVYSRDQVELPVTGGSVIVRTPDQYIDGLFNATAMTNRIFIDGGLSIGTRYIIDPETPDAVRGSLAFGSQTAYGSASLKLENWRFSLALTGSRSKLNRSSEMAPPGFAALSGSFVDQSARVGWRSRKLSVTTRYRTRWRPALNTGHRATVDLKWQEHALEFTGGVGYAKLPARTDVALPGSKTVLARLSAGFRTDSMQAAIGAVAQSELGDRTVVDSPEDVDTSLNLFTLQNKNYVFGRLFWQRDRWLLSADIEATPAFDHARAFVQVTWGHGWRRK
jgi:hypothetical protein